MKTINGLFLMFVLMERKKDGRKEYTAKDKNPADFKGHSMSVSDVVIVNRDGDMKAYYVDSFGFADLPDFVRQRQEILEIEGTEAHLDVGETSSCISFYVAECYEFPVLGEFHQNLTLEQAFELFDQIPGSRKFETKR